MLKILSPQSQEYAIEVSVINDDVYIKDRYVSLIAGAENDPNYMYILGGQ